MMLQRRAQSSGYSTLVLKDHTTGASEKGRVDGKGEVAGDHCQVNNEYREARE
jgi:hypothetical protein